MDPLDNKRQLNLEDNNEPSCLKRSKHDLESSDVDIDEGLSSDLVTKSLETDLESESVIQNQKESRNYNNSPLQLETNRCVLNTPVDGTVSESLEATSEILATDDSPSLPVDYINNDITSELVGDPSTEFLSNHSNSIEDSFINNEHGLKLSDPMAEDNTSFEQSTTPSDSISEYPSATVEPSEYSLAANFPEGTSKNSLAENQKGLMDETCEHFLSVGNKNLSHDQEKLNESSPTEQFESFSTDQLPDECFKSKNLSSNHQCSAENRSNLDTLSNEYSDTTNEYGDSVSLSSDNASNLIRESVECMNGILDNIESCPFSSHFSKTEFPSYIKSENSIVFNETGLLKNDSPYYATDSNKSYFDSSLFNVNIAPEIDLNESNDKTDLQIENNEQTISTESEEVNSAPEVCPQCLEIPIDPVFLHCSHILCRRKCAGKIMNKFIIICPVCIKKTYLNNGVEELYSTQPELQPQSKFSSKPVSKTVKPSITSIKTAKTAVGISQKVKKSDYQMEKWDWKKWHQQDEQQVSKATTDDNIENDVSREQEDATTDILEKEISEQTTEPVASSDPHFIPPPNFLLQQNRPNWPGGGNMPRPWMGTPNPMWERFRGFAGATDPAQHAHMMQMRAWQQYRAQYQEFCRYQQHVQFQHRMQQQLQWQQFQGQQQEGQTQQNPSQNQQQQMLNSMQGNQIKFNQQQQLGSRQMQQFGPHPTSQQSIPSKTKQQPLAQQPLAQRRHPNPTTQKNQIQSNKPVSTSQMVTNMDIDSDSDSPTTESEKSESLTLAQVSFSNQPVRYDKDKPKLAPPSASGAVSNKEGIVTKKSVNTLPVHKAKPDLGVASISLPSPITAPPSAPQMSSTQLPTNQSPLPASNSTNLTKQMKQFYTETEDKRESRAEKKPKEGFCILINNLPPDTKAVDIKTLVSKYGKVESCKIGKSKKEGSKGLFAIVLLEKLVSATIAVKGIDGMSFCGATLSAKKMKDDPSKK